MAPDSRRSAGTMPVVPVSSALACTSTIGSWSKTMQVPGAVCPATWCTLPRRGTPVPMSMICRIPASPAKSLTARCRNARFARAPPGACGAARQQPTDSVASGIVVLAAGQSVVHPGWVRSGRCRSPIARTRSPSHPSRRSWHGRLSALYLVCRPGKRTITDRHGHRHRRPGQRRRRVGQQAPMRRVFRARSLPADYAPTADLLLEHNPPYNRVTGTPPTVTLRSGPAATWAKFMHQDQREETG